MTDPTVPAGEPFVIIPTLDGFLELERRVNALERTAPPTVDLEPADAERLDRHRQDIDELKRRYNELLLLLRPYFPAITAPSAPAPTITAQESPL